MGFVKGQRPTAPWSDHSWWGQFDDGTSLPNMAGSDIQVSSTELQRGDMAWSDVDETVYVCINPTAGSALWAPIALGGGVTPRNALFDAFGRLRVSNPQTLFDSKQIVKNGTPISFVEYTSGTGASITYDVTNAQSVLTSGTDSGGRAVRQTRRYFNYQPGKSQLLNLTFNLEGPETGCEKRAGSYDDDNGIFFALPASGVPTLNVRSTTAVASESVSQPDWNLDTLDGNGPSRLTLDPTKSQILVIDYQWLSVGQVRVGFNIGGTLTYAHAFEHSNIVTGAYTQTPNYPIRYEIVNTAAAASPQMTAICCDVVSEGGHEETGEQRGFGVATPVSIGVGGRAPLFSLRLNAAYPRAPVFPTDFSVAAATQTARGIAELVWNPTLTGASWGNLPDTLLAADSSATALSGGIVLSAIAVGGGQGQAGFDILREQVTHFTSDFLGTTQDIITLAFTSVASDAWIGAMNWRELG